MAKVRRTGRCDCSTSRIISSFSAAGYLIRGRPQLLPGRRFHRREGPVMFFLSRRFSRLRSATSSFSAKASARRSFTSPVRSSGKQSPRLFSDPPHTWWAVSPASRFLAFGTASNRWRLVPHQGIPSTSCNTGFGPSSDKQSPGLFADPPPPSLRHSAAMLPSPRRPDSTIRIFELLPENRTVTEATI